MVPLVVLRTDGVAARVIEMRDLWLPGMRVIGRLLAAPPGPSETAHQAQAGGRTLRSDYDRLITRAPMTNCSRRSTSAAAPGPGASRELTDEAGNGSQLAADALSVSGE